jgi:membrane protease YdiL (CAAX protease family)
VNPRLDARRAVLWASLFVLLGLVNYAGNLATQDERTSDAFYTYEFAAGAVFVFAILLGLVLLIARGLPRRDVFALRRPTSLRLAAAGAIGVVLGTLAFAAALSPLLQPGDEQGLLPREWDPDRAAVYVVNGLVVALFVPIVEELSFRGLGVSLLMPLGERWAIAGVGLLFAFAHGLFEALPVFIAFGGALAWLRLRTRSVFPCIAAHALFNTIAVVAAAFEAANGGS